MGLIKPGAMGDGSNPANKPGEFANSMAEAMEDAFNELLGNDGIKTFAVANNTKESRDRRRLFVAIALGMVRHLKSNADGLQILDSLNTPTGEQIVVNTDPNPL